MKYFSNIAVVISAVFFLGMCQAAYAGNNNQGGCIGNCPTTNNITNKGGVAHANASANVTVKNKLTNEQFQGQHQGQVQGQVQGQKQSANNTGNHQTIEAAASSAMAPSINPTALCQVPVTLGGQAIIGGGSFGTTYTAEDCVQREDTRLFCEFALRGMSKPVVCETLLLRLPTVRKLAEELEEQETAQATQGSVVSQPSTPSSDLYRD